MNETADIANNIPAIVLLSMWWAFLSTLDMLLTPREPDKADRIAAKPADGDEQATPDDPGLREFRKLDPEFNAETFLRGAERAYETVLQAYAAGDLATLRPLLSTEVLETFAEACAERIARQETLELTFIGIESAEIVGAATTAEAMEITVLLRAHVVSAELSATGDVLRGDPVAVMITTDLWTFSRPMPAGGAEWRIVATDEG